MLKRPPPEPDPNHHLMMIGIGAAAIATVISISIGMSQSSRGASTTSSDTTVLDTSNQTSKKDALLKKIHKNRLLSSLAVYALSLLGGILVIGVSQQCVWTYG